MRDRQFEYTEMTLKPHTYAAKLTFSIVDGNIRPTLIQLHDFVDEYVLELPNEWWIIHVHTENVPPRVLIFLRWSLTA